MLLNRLLSQKMPDYAGWMPLFEKNEKDQLRLFQALLSVYRKVEIDDLYLRMEEEFLKGENPILSEVPNEEGIAFTTQDPLFLEADALILFREKGKPLFGNPLANSLENRLLLKEGINLKVQANYLLNEKAMEPLILSAKRVPIKNIVFSSWENLETVLNLAAERGWKRLVLQVPEGVRNEKDHMIRTLESNLKKSEDPVLISVLLIEEDSEKTQEPQS